MQAAETTDLLTPSEAARVLRRSLSALNRDRSLKTGLPFVRVGPRTIRYRRADIESFIAGRRVGFGEEE